MSRPMRETSQIAHYSLILFIIRYCLDMFLKSLSLASLFTFILLINILPNSISSLNDNCSIDSLNAAYIDTAVNAISTVSSGTADVLMSLEYLSPKAAFFLKAIIPVGSVIVAEINPEPQTEEYKQLMDFKLRTDEIWLLNQRAINSSTSGIGLNIIGSQYIDKVTHPINVMKNLTNEFTNPTIYKSREFEAAFKTQCKFGKKAPEEILAYLLLRLVTYCQEPISQGQVEIYVAKRAYLMHVALRFKVVGEKVPDIGPYLKDFFNIYDNLKDKVILDIDTLAVVFNQTFATYSSAFGEFFRELRSRGGLGQDEEEGDTDAMEDCYLRYLLKGTNFNFPRVEAFTLQLKNQLIDLGYMAGICANLTYEGHQASIDNYAKTISDNISLISKHTVNWLNISLENAWPSCYQQILQEELVRVVPNPGLVTKENLRITIQLALPKFELTGSPNYVYQSLIAVSADEKFFFEGIQKYCSLQINLYGFKAVINRIQMNYTDIYEREAVHYKMVEMHRYATVLNYTVQATMKSLYNADNLTNIANTLKAKMGGEEVISAQNFHGWVVLREFGNWPWEPCPTIQYTKQSYNYGKLHGTNTLPFQTNGHITEDCEIFRFIFFL